MIDFRPITIEDKAAFERLSFTDKPRGCEFTFANLFLWGRQRMAQLHGHILLFSQFDRRTVYPFPVGSGEKKPVLDAIIADAAERGIPCRLTGLTGEDIALLEELYPHVFLFHCDRGSFDYVYAIDDLADLAGRKYQRKRNHINRFAERYPEAVTEPLSADNVAAVRAMLDTWYAVRQAENATADLAMEKAALYKALQYAKPLGMDGLVLKNGEEILAFTLGSLLSETVFDVQFEKALPDADGAYPTINRAMARWVRDRYPSVRFLNREEDMGLEGLRKAKESYYPHHLTEKCWAHLREDGYDY